MMVILCLTPRVFTSLAAMKLLIFHMSHSSESAFPASDGNVSKLPKLDVRTFNGDILQWQSFWKQFEVSVYSRASPENAEKLAYLQQAIKNGSAWTVIDGLSHSGERSIQ